MLVQLELEDNLEESESNVDEDIEGIWEKIQAGGLIPETCTFSEYTENDSQLQTCETIIESSILDDLRQCFPNFSPIAPPVQLTDYQTPP